MRSSTRCRGDSIEERIARAHKQLDSLDSDEADDEIKQPISSAIPDKHDARDDPIEQEPKTEEIIEENKLFRVECPYSDVNGKKCKVIAFSTKKAEAYQKLKEHVIENHPEKIKEFTARAHFLYVNVIVIN